MGILFWLSKIIHSFGHGANSNVVDNYSSQQSMKGVINFGTIQQTQTAVNAESNKRDGELEKFIKVLNGSESNLHRLAIMELCRISSQEEENAELRNVICDCLCQYLSSHSESQSAFNALFKKGSVFNHVKKEIRDANFNKLKLIRFYTIENVSFVNCRFNNCFFNKIHFRNCNVSGGEIRGCTFRDNNKISECNFKDTIMDGLYLRYTQFTDVKVRGGRFSSSTVSRSNFRGVSLFEMNFENLTFQICAFREYDFSNVKMKDVKFVFKKSNSISIKDMLEYLCHMGYKPSIEYDSGSIAVI